MIVHPDNWATIGTQVMMQQLEDTLREILAGIDCDCLSYSGGIDSSLILYYLLEAGREVKVFTMTCDVDHPDYTYAWDAITAFEQRFGVEIERHFSVSPGKNGDDLVREFYRVLPQWTDSIITGDGIDEFMAGYYGHQADPCEDVYYGYLRKLQENHLAPLNENSGDIKVYLPYMDKRFIHLMTQIPLSQKVCPEERKQVVVALAQGKVPQEVIERKKYGFGTRV